VNSSRDENREVFNSFVSLSLSWPRSLNVSAFSGVSMKFMTRVNDQMFEKYCYPFVPRSHSVLFVSSVPNAEMHANLTSRIPTLMLCGAKSVAKYPKRLNYQSSIDLLRSNFLMISPYRYLEL
jgi:hypothetical protein